MLKILKHPLIIHKLTQLRRRETCSRDFGHILNEIAGLMVYEITRDLPLQDTRIETPLSPFDTEEVNHEIVLVAILRAGLGMVDGIRRMVPTAKVGHMGMYRNEETLEPVMYYAKFPANLLESAVMVLDPMLATGGSASAAITELKRQGAVNIKLVCIVGAPEGVKRVETDHPDVEIILAALDDGLNDKGYIVPGLGDAGDRLFGTK
jgi:uracil phosphoribosyltransferase